MKNSCFIFHSWGMWGAYQLDRKNEAGAVIQLEKRQARSCEWCGKEQDVLIAVI